MIPEVKPFFVSTETNAIVRALMSRRAVHPINILLKGKHGMGKSEFARQIAAVNKMDYVSVAMTLLQEAGQVLGHDEFKDNQTQTVVSRFTTGIQTQNSLIHLEELNRPESPKALGELFPILDDSRCIHHDKLGTIKVANGVVFVATLNEGWEYTGIDPLDAALRDRFTQIELNYLPPEIESTLVITRTGLDKSKADELVRFANGLRLNQREPIHVSTRKVIGCAELIVAGLPMPTAVKCEFGLDADKLESVLLSLDLSGNLDRAASGIEVGFQLLTP